MIVRKSKTDQFGEGQELYLCVPTTGLKGASPAFVRVFRSNRIEVNPKPLYTTTIARIIKHRAAREGWTGCAGHSFRIGSAVSLIRHGASVVEILQVGRWRSETMISRYVRGEQATQGAVARYRDRRE